MSRAKKMAEKLTELVPILPVCKDNSMQIDSDATFHRLAEFQDDIARTLRDAKAEGMEEAAKIVLNYYAHGTYQATLEGIAKAIKRRTKEIREGK